MVDFKVQQRRYRTNEKIIVSTTYGPIKGVKRKTIYGDSYYSFEGIPFAKPPLGDLRYKAPLPPDSWTDVRSCTSVGPKPLQKHFVFQMTEATRDLYSPDYLLREEVVVVSITYRVGPFGFLSLQDCDIEVPGNAGLKDQVMALRWIKANCSRFGGDSENITLFGDSAGAASVHYMMLTEQTRNLFHKAICMSGCALSPWAVTPQRNWPYRLAKAAGYTGDDNELAVFEFLSQAKGADIVKANEDLCTDEEKRERIGFSFGPVIEPYLTQHCVVPKAPTEMMRTAWGNTIPMIIGGVSNEGLLLYTETKNNPKLLNELGDCRYVMVSHEYFWFPIYRTVLSRLEYASSAPTYLYRFDFDSKHFNHLRIISCGKKVRGTCHGDDLSYIFYNSVARKLKKHTKEYKCIERLVGMWTQFAASSNPNYEKDQNELWLPVTMASLEKNQLKCLNIADDLKIIEVPDMDKLLVWEGFYTSNQLL
uniref:Carboxylic ester hydrolase n=1 Tax=Glossina morsitans morsitans TaxID=37546 RepID=A0A1B0G6M7_GLOMM